MSPDTDIYNIGLPLPSISNKNIVVQLNPYSSKELKYLDLTAFLEVWNDPDLSFIPAANIPQIFQSLFVSTGCDYISVFSEMGKASFSRYFYQHAEFISSGNSFPGTLADTGLTNNQFETGFLAFLRLVGSVYFKKHKSGFSQSTPRSHYCTFQNLGLTPLESHEQWIEDIRTKVGERCQFENQMVSSTDALYRHWKRSCWVIDMWRQADHTEITLQPLVQYGWIVKNDTLTFDWESEKNVSGVQERVHGLLKGCKCKTGCGSKRCGCKGKDRKCCIGCECVNCTNTDADCSSSSSLTTTSGDTNLMKFQQQTLTPPSFQKMLMT